MRLESLVLYKIVLLTYLDSIEPGVYCAFKIKTEKQLEECKGFWHCQQTIKQESGNQEETNVHIGWILFLEQVKH